MGLMLLLLLLHIVCADAVAIVAIVATAIDTAIAVIRGTSSVGGHNTRRRMEVGLVRGRRS